MKPTISLQSDATQEQLSLILAIVQEVEDVPGIICEIGSWKCGTSSLIAMSTTKNVYAFDLFGGLPYEQDGFDHALDRFAENDFEAVKRTAAQFKNLGLVKGLHEHTVPLFADMKPTISMIFLDSDHYGSHKVTLEKLAPLLSPNGVIVFHDWFFRGVQEAVFETLDMDAFEQLSGECHGMGVLRKRPCPQDIVTAPRRSENFPQSAEMERNGSSQPTANV